MSSSDEELIDSAIFQEPSDYYPSPKPATFESWTLQTGQTLQLRLVGHNPLWGHHLWNGAQVVTDYLYEHRESLVLGKNVLELGAGAGLPSLAAAIWGARHVVMTDYPDAELVENMKYNVEAAKNILQSTSNVVVQINHFGLVNSDSSQGHVWGADTEPLLAPLPSNSGSFDTLILADLLFNHSQHAALVSTIKATLAHSPGAAVLAFFTPYTPWKFDKDMAFFDLAQEGGLQVTQVVKRVLDKLMFKDDRGDELLRRTVFGYTLTWTERNR
ncbi:MAG: hypothetical protein Q9219_000808 [cf. Caloplaca sp. 3 TL-2023]